jgi:hypothetical protein
LTVTQAIIPLGYESAHNGDMNRKALKALIVVAVLPVVLLIEYGLNVDHHKEIDSISKDQAAIAQAANRDLEIMAKDKPADINEPSKEFEDNHKALDQQLNQDK